MKLMKVLSAAVALMMVAVIPTTQAMAQNASVENAINELNYTLSVEWDQKDPAVKKAAYEKFSAEIAQLQAQGVSNDEIYSTIKSKVLTAQAGKDVDAIIGLAKSGRISAQEAQKQLGQYLSKAEARGANWSSGATLGAVGITLVIVGLLALAIASGGSVGVTYVETCGYYCSDWDPYYGWYDYYCCY